MKTELIINGKVEGVFDIKYLAQIQAKRRINGLRLGLTNEGGLNIEYKSIKMENHECK